VVIFILILVAFLNSPQYGLISKLHQATPEGALVTYTPEETQALNGMFLQARNKSRTLDQAALIAGLEKYFTVNKKYPQSLGELTLEYIEKNDHVTSDIAPYERIDPSTGLRYEYKALPGAQNFELCVTFEPNNRQCVSHDYR
jgi:hypothetical protein